MTKAKRIKRHNKIVEFLCEAAVKQGWESVMEQVWTIPESGQRLKPDIVCKKDLRVVVIDATVRWEYDRNGVNSLDQANAEKVSKYRPLADTLKGALGVTRVDFFGFAIGARGGWTESSASALKSLGLKKTQITIFSSKCCTTALRSTIKILGIHSDGFVEVVDGEDETSETAETSIRV